MARKRRKGRDCLIVPFIRSVFLDGPISCRTDRRSVLSPVQGPRTDRRSVLLFKAPTEQFPFRADPPRAVVELQACLRRIRADVLNDPVQVFFNTNDSIEALFLPKCAALAKAPIDLESGVCFSAL